MSLKSFLVCSWLWLWFPLSLAMRGHLTSLDQSVVAPKQKHCGEAISWNPGFSVGWMCFSHWNPTKASLDFFSQRNHGALLCFFFSGVKVLSLFKPYFFWWFFGGGWQQHCHLKCPVTVRLVEKTVILSRWSTSMQLSGMWNKFHASSDQNPPSHISLYWLVFLGFGILIMADYNP